MGCASPSPDSTITSPSSPAKAEGEFVSVDGVQVYPRRGHTIIASDPAWSKDGEVWHSSRRRRRPNSLVLLAEFDNPTGDTTWDLPPPPPRPPRSRHAGVVERPGKLVVARSSTKPLFSTSFVKENRTPAQEHFKNAGP